MDHKHDNSVYFSFDLLIQWLKHWKANMIKDVDLLYRSICHHVPVSDPLDYTTKSKKGRYNCNVFSSNINNENNIIETKFPLNRWKHTPSMRDEREIYTV